MRMNKKLLSKIFIIFFILNVLIMAKTKDTFAGVAPTWTVTNNGPDSGHIYYNDLIGTPHYYSYELDITNNKASTLNLIITWELYVGGLLEDSDSTSESVAASDSETNQYDTTAFNYGDISHGGHSYYYSITLTDSDDLDNYGTKSTSSTTFYGSEGTTSSMSVIITNPTHNEIFSYTTTIETFTVEVIFNLYTGIALSSFSASYMAFHSIDSVFKSPTETISSSDKGSYLEFKWTYTLDVDISTYSVGLHNYIVDSDIVSIYYSGNGCNYNEPTDSNNWYRDNPPPTYPPSIAWVSPENNWEVYNRTKNGNDYTIRFTPTDPDNDITSIDLWTDGILNETWTNPTSTVTLANVVITPIDGLYNFTIKATDSLSNTYTTTRYMYVVSLGGSINTTIYARDDTYLKEGPYIKIGTLDEEGLDNCTILIDIIDVNITRINNINAIVCNLTVDSLISICDYYKAIDFIVTYDRVEAWNETFIIVDNGSVYPYSYLDFVNQDSGEFGKEWFAYIDENGYLRPFLNDNGNRVEGYHTDIQVDDFGTNLLEKPTTAYIEDTCDDYDGIWYHTTDGDNIANSGWGIRDDGILWLGDDTLQTNRYYGTYVLQSSSFTSLPYNNDGFVYEIQIKVNDSSQLKNLFMLVTGDTQEGFAIGMNFTSLDIWAGYYYDIPPTEVIFGDYSIHENVLSIDTWINLRITLCMGQFAKYEYAINNGTWITFRTSEIGMENIWSDIDSGDLDLYITAYAEAGELDITHPMFAVNYVQTYELIYNPETDIYIDDNGNRYFEFVDESEYYVDTGDVYSSTGYTEDTMSIQPATDWTDYKNIVLTNPTSTTFTNFVAYVKVTKETEMQADYDDLRFYDSTGTTLLDYEVAEYDGSFAHCWVEIPSFTGSGTYTIKMLYGNIGASNAENLQGTWDDNNIELAMHLDTNDDSSGNSYDFTDTGDGVSYSASQIGDGVELQGTNDYLLLAQGSGATELHNLGTTFTILSWIKTDDEAYHCQYSMEADELSLLVYPRTGSTEIYRTEADSYYMAKYAETGLVAGTYFHNTFKSDGADIEWFTNGVSATSTTWGANLNEADNDIFIGVEQALNNDMDGFIDELFVVSEAWSAHEIEAFYEFQGNQATYVSTGSEQTNYGDWDVGSEFTWEESADASGERNSTTMTFWNDNAGDYVRVKAQEEDLLLREPVDNYAVSYEVRVATETFSELYGLGFCLYAGNDGTNNFFKIALTQTTIYAGLSTSTYAHSSMTSGKYSTDSHSWAGEWITLNITILNNIKVFYFVDDILIRESLFDSDYWNVTNVDCGMVYLSVYADTGDTCKISVDYFNTIDYGLGKTGSNGQTYYEYSAPSSTRFNGSYYMTSPALNDVSALYSQWGGGTWHDYRYMDNVRYETRMRFDTDSEYNYYQNFGLNLKTNGTAYFIHIRMRDDLGSANKAQLSLNSHVFSGYGTLAQSGYSSIDVFDGNWHTYRIDYRDNICVTAYVDGTMIANMTDAIWFEALDSLDSQNNQAAFGSGTPAGATRHSVMEIDYWRVYNWTYNWDTSSEGWDYTNTGYDCYGTRSDDGILSVSSDISINKKQYLTIYDSYDINANEMPESFIETKVRFTNDSTDYDHYVLSYWIDASPSHYYASLIWYANGTIAAITTNGGIQDWWSIYSVYETTSISWDTNWHTFRIHIDHNNYWVAWIFDGQLIANETLSSLDFD